jgi:hypothetical protein
MLKRYFVNIEPIEPSDVALSVEGLPGLLVFGEATDEALRRAREAIGFQLRDAIAAVYRPLLELVPRDALGVRPSGLPPPQPQSTLSKLDNVHRLAELGRGTTTTAAGATGPNVSRIPLRCGV